MKIYVNKLYIFVLLYLLFGAVPANVIHKVVSCYSCYELIYLLLLTLKQLSTRPLLCSFGRE